MSAGKPGNRTADSSGALQAQGFRGGCETVRRLTVHWHTERGRSGPPPKRQASKPPPRRAPPAPATRPLSPRQARWLLLKPEVELKPEQRLYLEHLGRSNPEVLIAQQLVLAFLQLVRERAAESLEPWIERARASGLPELVEFAKGLVRDRAAVEAALRCKWSNSITEGHVNRLSIGQLPHGRRLERNERANHGRVVREDCQDHDSAGASAEDGRGRVAHVFDQAPDIIGVSREPLIVVLWPIEPAAGKAASIIGETV